MMCVNTASGGALPPHLPRDARPAVIYLDSSALLKLLHEEPESAPSEQWLSARARTPVVSNALARLEVLRACRRLDTESLPEARARSPTRPPP